MSHHATALPLMVRGARTTTGHTVDVLCFDGVLQDPAAAVMLDRVEEIDARGLLVVPGLVDLHQEVALPDLTDLARHLPTDGVTAWLPTLTAPDPADLAAAGRTVARLQEHPVGAVPLGLHVVAPSPALGAEELRQAGVRMVTVAPERSGALTALAAWVDAGILVSVGHSSAPADTVRAAVDLGARWGSHLGWRTPALAATDPGPLGALLADPRTALGVAAHPEVLAPETLRICWAVLGPHRMLSTSAPRQVGGTLIEGLRHLVGVTRCDLDEALLTATATPASALSEGTRGTLAPGSRADLVLLDPAGLEVTHTVLGGRLVHSTSVASD